MSPEKTIRQKKIMIVVILMVFASVIAVATIMLDEKQVKAERFSDCAGVIDSANAESIDLDDLDVVIKYCMTFGSEATKQKIALHGLN